MCRGGFRGDPEPGSLGKERLSTEVRGRDTVDGWRQAEEVLMAGRWWWVPWDMASPGTSQLTDQPMASF